MSIALHKVSRFAVALVLLVFPAASQSQAKSAGGDSAFEVAVIKPSPPSRTDLVNRMIKPLPGGTVTWPRTFPCGL